MKKRKAPTTTARADKESQKYEEIAIKKRKIIAFLRKNPEPLTCRMISKKLSFDICTVSGILNALFQKEITKRTEKKPCLITGYLAYYHYIREEKNV